MTTLSPTGFLSIGAQRLEYRMLGPPPDAAPFQVYIGLGQAF